MEFVPVQNSNAAVIYVMHAVLRVIMIESNNKILV
jgi:hypothetical protein